MNIIWEMPDHRIAVTTIMDGSDPVEHSKLLIERGNIPSDWVVMATDYQGEFPSTPQEYWYWDDGLKTVPVPEQPEIDPVQKLREFLEANPEIKAIL
jgi:hypothetical protein